MSNKRWLALPIVLAAGASSPGLAYADPLPEGCVKVSGQISCVQSEPVGNSGRTKDTVTEQKASFQSSHPEENSFENPADHKPPGQQ